MLKLKYMSFNKNINPNCVFVPVAVGAFGLFGPSAACLFHCLVKALVLESGDCPVSLDLHRRFSFAVQR